MHRAQQVLNAIDAALPNATLMPGWKPDQAGAFLWFGGLEHIGDPAPNEMSAPTNVRLRLFVDVFAYDLEGFWHTPMWDALAEVHRAIMDPATYAGLDWVIAQWLGDTEPVEVATETELTHAFLRAEFFVDYRYNPDDPEN